MIRKCLLALVVALTATMAMAADLDRLQDASVLISVGKGSGSGTLVTRQVGAVTKTFVWTAGHVVDALRQPDGSYSNATVIHETRYKGKVIGNLSVQAKVVAYSDPERGEDLALLEVLQDNFRPVGVSAKFDLVGDIVPVGTDLIHVGCTLGLYNSVSYGIMSQTDRDLLKTGKVFDQTSCMCYPGSSGGGIFTKDGVYVGMLVRGAGAGLNFIVPMRRMLPWAKKMGIMWALDDKLPVPSDAERAKLKISDGAEAPSLPGFPSGPMDPNRRRPLQPRPPRKTIIEAIAEAIVNVIVDRLPKIEPKPIRPSTPVAKPKPDSILPFVAGRYNTRSRTDVFFKRIAA